MVSWWMVGIALAVIAFVSMMGAKKKDVRGKVILITGGARYLSSSLLPLLLPFPLSPIFFSKDKVILISLCT
jgi:hypothetical protein